jgi:hypothetical protein
MPFFKTRERHSKTGLAWGVGTSGRGGNIRKGWKEAEYSGNIMYSWMKMDNDIFWNYSRNWGERIKVNDGWGEFNHDVF